MSVARSLVKLGFGAVCVLGGVTFAPLLTGGGVILATALGNVAAGNTANAIDALTAGEEGDRPCSETISRQYPQELRKNCSDSEG
ncbi:MAG: hypothetical protein J7647_00855 [Cyanobacteria bacterium SBLK]|nr:hypothetical protein [Cyanobacteria bacterium SBLK]